MAEQTPPAGAKIIDLVDVIEEPTPTINEDELDSLLAELETPASASAPAPIEVDIPVADDAPAAAGSLADSDLDSLLSDLAGSPPAAPVASAAPAVGASAPQSIVPTSSSDLDSLLNDLAGSPGPAPADDAPLADNDLDSLLNDLADKAQAAPAAPATAADFEDFNPDDLDALLNDLASKPPSEAATEEAPVVTAAPAPEAAATPAPAAQPAANAPAFDSSELDALLNELSSQQPPAPETASPDAPATPSQATPSESTGLLNADDLDSLLAEIAPTSGAPATEVNAQDAEETSAPVDSDLDFLLADLDNAALTEDAPAPTPAATETPPAAPAGAGNDLDFLLADLEGSEEAPAAAGQNDGNLDDGDLDALLAELENDDLETTAPAPSAPAAGQDDLDALLADLEESATSLPDAEPARVPAPSAQAAAPHNETTLTIPENLLASFKAITPHLDAALVQDIYHKTLETVLQQVVPGLVAQEVTRQVAKEIEAIKKMAALDEQ